MWCRDKTDRKNNLIVGKCIMQATQLHTAKIQFSVSLSAPVLCEFSPFFQPPPPAS